MKIDETFGEREVREKYPQSREPYLKYPLETKKWNIGSEENPKMVKIRDY
jgi:hypothetical protein